MTSLRTAAAAVAMRRRGGEKLVTDMTTTLAAEMREKSWAMAKQARKKKEKEKAVRASRRFSPRGTARKAQTFVPRTPFSCRSRRRSEPATRVEAAAGAPEAGPASTRTRRAPWRRQTARGCSVKPSRGGTAPIESHKKRIYAPRCFLYINENGR